MKRLFCPCFLFVLALSLACNLASGPAPIEETAPPTHPPPVAPTQTSPSIVVLPSPGASPVSPGLWRPAPGLAWQWQLGDPPIDTSFDVEMYDLDLFETDASLVAALHAQGRKVICYISVGSWEDWRPDVDRFPPEVIGKDYEGWEGEKWLDIRQIEKLAPVLRTRIGDVSFDRANGLLYVLELYADGARPIVHVWRIR